MATVGAAVSTVAATMFAAWMFPAAGAFVYMPIVTGAYTVYLIYGANTEAEKQAAFVSTAWKPAILYVVVVAATSGSVIRAWEGGVVFAIAQFSLMKFSTLLLNNI